MAILLTTGWYDMPVVTPDRVCIAISFYKGIRTMWMMNSTGMNTGLQWLQYLLRSRAQAQALASETSQELNTNNYLHPVQYWLSV